VLPTTPARRFPPPWSVEELDACFVVRDHAGQKLAYVYFEDKPGRRSAAKLLTRDERGSRRTSPSCRSYAEDKPFLMSAFGGKADMSGPDAMSAFDPKQTSTASLISPFLRRNAISAASKSREHLL
jgi:hypothetical protein